MVARADTKYEGNDASVHRILLTPEYAAAAGSPPTGAVDNDIRPKVSKTNGEFGLRPRGVRLSRTIGTAPDTFKKYAFLPVLTIANFNSPTFANGATVTIGSDTWTIVAKVAEDY